MKKLSSILLIIVFAILLAWLLPWCFSFLNSKKSSSSFVLYSTVNDDFIASTSVDGQRVISDTKGNIYTQHELDSLLPFFYGRQLLKDERFPDSVKGIPTNYRDSQHESFFWRSSPRDINAPKVGVYQLMESASQRVQLESPTDVFRINKNGIEFIDAETNSKNVEKSNSFTDMLNKKGFAFPAKYFSGVPSVKKEYDEGYLLIDNNDQLFHMKQMVGRPFVRKIDLPDGITPKHVFITEHRNRKSIGYVVDEKGHFYVVGLPGYKFTKVQIPAFNPETMSMMIYANPFDWTIKVGTVDGANCYAVDAENFTLLGQYSDDTEPTMSDKVGSFISSIGLRFTSPLDKFVKPRIGI